MKLVNPLYYPLAVLAGAIALVAGVRAELPNKIVLPVSAIVATAGAYWLKSREPESFDLNNPELERELQTAYTSAKLLANRANALRLEAVKLLTDSFQMELLAAVQYACDRTNELPPKIGQLARRLQGSDSLPSVNDLQQQLMEVKTTRSSSDASRQRLSQLANSLGRNVKLAREGQDVRHAQIVSLSTLIQDSAGVLQRLQNQLRTSDLTDAEQVVELQVLSDELSSFQADVDLLVGK